MEVPRTRRLLAAGDTVCQDMIVFVPRPSLVTHRVVGPVPDDVSAFRTRGDANAAIDPAAVPARLVRGKVLWSVSVLGAVLGWAAEVRRR